MRGGGQIQFQFSNRYSRRDMLTYHVEKNSCSDTTVPFPSPIQMTPFFPSQNGEKGRFRSRNGFAQQNPSIFAKTGPYEHSIPPRV